MRESLYRSRSRRPAFEPDLRRLARMIVRRGAGVANVGSRV
jgi:hypothetical protein